ncbi:MAG: putative 1-aminocyclopropane-1-carboxylate deaminase [bacterium]|nr:MAG: putative 1-aminocyclopropane-1-carboxylate deaminase [bacterium]
MCPDPMTRLPIFKEYPKLKETVPWIPLGDFPTKVTSLSRITESLSCKSFWVKRDSESSSLYGGNKVRKLEFEFGKLMERKSEMILAYGSLGSNFTIAACLFAKTLDIPTHLILYDTVNTPFVMANFKHNCKMAQNMTRIRSPLSLPYAVSRELWRHRGKQVYLMPPGGSSPLSTLGYINAMLELKGQIDDGELPMPDYIFLPVGTGGTLVGLLIAKVLFNLPVKIIGMAVVDWIITNPVILKLFIYRSVRFFNQVAGTHLRASHIFKELHLDYRSLGKGYAHSTDEAKRAKDLLKREENIILDETYTAKAMAGAIDIVRTDLKADTNVLFWHSFNSQDNGMTLPSEKPID